VTVVADIKRGIHARATAALLVASFVWGMSFTWAKAGGEAVNQATNAGAHSPLGPILLLSVRFGIASVVMLLAVPSARKWTAISLRRGLVLGLLLSVPLIFQHLTLDRTSEALTAFLTCLPILFVPFLETIWLGRAPERALWLGMGVAMVGVALLMLDPHASLGWGAMVGLGCAAVFSVHILVLNTIVPRDNPWRMCMGQFVTTAVVTAIIALSIWIIEPGTPRLSVRSLAAVLSVGPVWQNALLLAALATLVSFGLMARFQPLLDPTQAALIYLLEPVFAAVYASVAAGHELVARAWIGAALILGANVLVEWLRYRGRRRSVELAQQPAV
jgi:drug/metabolite transporter (DMT)-like permease